MIADEQKLYAEDLAKLLNVTVRAAQMHLARLEAKYGVDVVGTERRHLGGRPRRYTTKGALAQIAPRSGRVAISSERRLDDIEARLESQARELAELRRRIDAR